MRRLEESAFRIMAGSVMWPTAVFAEESSKVQTGYSGSDYLWFSIIAIVLVYGVYDTFFKTP